MLYCTVGGVHATMLIVLRSRGGQFFIKETIVLLLLLYVFSAYVM